MLLFFEHHVHSNPLRREIDSLRKCAFRRRRIVTYTRGPFVVVAFIWYFFLAICCGRLPRSLRNMNQKTVRFQNFDVPLWPLSVYFWMVRLWCSSSVRPSAAVYVPSLSRSYLCCASGSIWEEMYFGWGASKLLYLGSSESNWDRRSMWEHLAGVSGD